MPLLNSTIPPSPPLLWNSSSSVDALTACRCGNTAKANGSANIDVVKIRPRLTGRTILGLCFNHSLFCSLTSIRGGMTMIGVELMTRLNAVSPTASVAAFFDLPKLSTSFPSFSRACFSASESTGNTSIPRLISSPRMRNTLRAPALATAANGTRRESTVRVDGDNRFSRGTIELRPTATVHDALTARR